MKKAWKRNAVIAGVLVLVCAGVYLNWVYDAQTPELTQTLDADKILNEATLVMNDTHEPQQVLATQEGSRAEYFAQIRLSRQSARDEAVELLQETIAYAGEAGNESASRELEEIIAAALAEAQIESLLVAKGYEDCVACIGENGITLTLAAPEAGLTPADVAVAADIVLSQTNLELKDIRVIGKE